jgi:hypothetical protein
VSKNKTDNLATPRAFNGTTIEQQLDGIAATDIKLPKLSHSVLQGLAFEHYNQQRKGDGAPTADEVAKGFLSNNGVCSSTEQADNERKRKDWIAGRCVEYLRHRIAAENPALVELAATTDSHDLRAGVVYKIYRSIGEAFPSLAKAANEARIRKTQQLDAINQAPPFPPNPEFFNSLTLENSKAEPPTVTPTMTKEQLPEAWKDDAIIQGQANQIGNLILISLRMVHQYIKPAAAASGIALDEQSLHAWSVSCFIEMCKSSKAHFKLSTEREAIK